MAEDKSRLIAMYRRWAYMAIAVLASFLLTAGPAFSFLEDRGITYVRSFDMTQKTFFAFQTEIGTANQEIVATMSVKGLYYCYLAMLFSSIGALLFLMHPKGRLLMCDIAILAAGIYYVLLVVYALRISDVYFATLAPTWVAFMPAVVLEMMVLTHRNVIKYGHYLDEENAAEAD